MRWLVLLSGFICLQAHAQSRTFVERMKRELPLRDSTYALNTRKASREEYNFLSEGSGGLESLFLGHLHAEARNHPDELSGSNVLSIMARATTEVWKGSQYNKGKSWTGSTKYIRRAAYQSTCSFNLLRVAVFRITLVDNEGKQFYYDRNGSRDQLNLYKGKFPSYKERMDEDAPEPVPLHFFTEEKLLEQFERQLKRQSHFADLKKGNFCCVGISVQLDEKTLHRKKIPTARVVVIFGARRLKNVKPSTQATRSLANFDLEN